jgi:hypothetical protein
MRAIEAREIAPRLVGGRVTSTLTKETNIVAIKPARTELERTLKQLPDGFHSRLSNSSSKININMPI